MVERSNQSHNYTAVIPAQGSLRAFREGAPIANLVHVGDLGQRGLRGCRVAIGAAQRADALVAAVGGSVVALPPRLAVCFGSEGTGATPTLLAAADRRVYLPLHGFADSLNLFVSAAMIVQYLFHEYPELVPFPPFVLPPSSLRRLP